MKQTKWKRRRCFSLSYSLHISCTLTLPHNPNPNTNPLRLGNAKRQRSMTEMFGKRQKKQLLEIMLKKF
jgi:hypothetical protein